VLHQGISIKPILLSNDLKRPLIHAAIHNIRVNSTSSIANMLHTS